MLHKGIKQSREHEGCEDEHETGHGNQVDFVGFGTGFAPYENVEAESERNEVNSYFKSDERYKLTGQRSKFWVEAYAP